MSGLYKFMCPQVRWWPEHFIESANVHGAPHCIADYVYVGIPTNSGKFRMKHFLYYECMNREMNTWFYLFTNEIRTLWAHEIYLIAISSQIILYFMQMPPNIKFFQMLTHLFTAVFELGLFCWFGSSLITEVCMHIQILNEHHHHVWPF